MLVIKPRSAIQTARHGPTMFLVGSIDNGTAENWQERVQDELSDFDVTIYNPRRDDWNPDLKQDISEPEFAYQVNWELDRIESSDVIFVYFSPHGPAPITLLELGTLCGRDNIIVCCPEGYWRRGNVQVVCHRQGWEMHNDLDSAIAELKELLQDFR